MSNGNYRVLCGVTIDGAVVVGAGTVRPMQERGKIACIGYRYGSQMPYMVSARDTDGKLHLTTRTAARKAGWTVVAEAALRGRW